MLTRTTFTILAALAVAGPAAAAPAMAQKTAEVQCWHEANPVFDQDQCPGEEKYRTYGYGQPPQGEIAYPRQTPENPDPRAVFTRLMLDSGGGGGGGGGGQ